MSDAPHRARAAGRRPCGPCSSPEPASSRSWSFTFVAMWLLLGFLVRREAAREPAREPAGRDLRPQGAAGAAPADASGAGPRGAARRGGRPARRLRLGRPARRARPHPDRARDGALAPPSAEGRSDARGDPAARAGASGRGARPSWRRRRRSRPARPAALRDVGIDQRLGAQLPLDLALPRRGRARRSRSASTSGRSRSCWCLPTTSARCSARWS